jgi:hypothetical protein
MGAKENGLCTERVEIWDPLRIWDPLEKFGTMHLHL